MFFCTGKEVQLVAESRKSANIITFFFYLFTATSFILIKGNTHSLFFKLSHAQPLQVYLVFCIHCLLFFCLHIYPEKMSNSLCRELKILC